MSEQKQSFMVELDMWSSENVISPLYLACMRGPEEAIVEAKELVKKAIRTKVLESYHNGLDVVSLRVEQAAEKLEQSARAS